MEDDLDTLIRELESKMPDLRGLIAESETVIATTEDVQATSRRLALAIRLADAEASQLRRQLLGAMMPDATPEYPTAPTDTVADDYSDAARELERILEGKA